MADFSTDIRKVKGIGEKKAQAFARLGVFSLYDLIYYYPRKYEDRSVFKPFSLALDGESACFSAIVADEPHAVHIRRGLDMLKFKIADESGVADVTYFNQNWLKNNFVKGEEYVFYGKIEVSGRHRSLVNPVFEKAERSGVKTGTIVPVYGTTAGLSQKDITECVKAALESCESFIPEIIPEEFIKLRKLAHKDYSLKNIHFPKNFEALEISRRRLVYEELFVLACALESMHEERCAKPGIQFTEYDLNEFYSALPFEPTRAQKRCIEESVKDLISGSAMNRLLQGDVGSGKTLVAAALCWLTFKNGYQSAFMAPTEILAAQHYKTLGMLLSAFGVKTALLTGSMTAREKNEVKRELKDGTIDLIIGTHALISEDVKYSNLAFAVTDEQHRFGVNQRASLIAKANRPHVLVMSATPIPRTLALIIYGDLDVSIIDELPPGRSLVQTYSVNESYRKRIDAFIDKICAGGGQVFVVCPKVEEGEENTLNLKSAEEHSAALQKSHPGLKIGCVHGRMKPLEKEKLMNAFSSGEIDVLVSTTVIEVGVDVPNAVLMIIENADRFGLSQLHQLRGRVGRGKEQSYCILITDNDSEEVKSRLGIMCKTNDGFKISEEDLRIRGPGDFFGSRQHGLPEMHIANLGADTQVLKTAQDDARALLSKDPELSLPEHRELKEKIDRMFLINAERFN